MPKKALITGVYGQDGSYLAEILAGKGYEVHGVEKEPLSENAAKIKAHLVAKRVFVNLHKCDLNKSEDVNSLLKEMKPDECYHLAATHYSSSTNENERDRVSSILYKNNVISALNIIHAIKTFSKTTRLVLAGSCLMFDDVPQSPQNELMPFATTSIYGLSKIAASNLASLYRKAYNLHLSTAILYNHESPRRLDSFVTKKIAQNVVKIQKGEIKTFTLANLDSCKDWGYARDYAFGMWLMAQQKNPDDYILSTGKGHTVEEFVDQAFKTAGICDWKKHVKLDEGISVRTGAKLIGCSDKACKKLSWGHSMSFSKLVKLMVEAELAHSLD